MKQIKRKVDSLAGDIHSWWSKSFVFVKKTKINTWKGVLLLTFIAGAIVAIIWMVNLKMQTTSDALGESASLMLSPASLTVANGGTFNLNVLLNTINNNVVVTRAVIKFNPEDFQLVSWNTDNSIFSTSNACVYNSKPCQIIGDGSASGVLAITLAKPTPGVRNTAYGLIASLTLKALREVSPSAANITLAYAQDNTPNNSNVILDDGNGTDILKSVAGAKVVINPIVCTGFTYSDWGVCDNGTQVRTVISNVPAGCKGGNPVLTQSCVVVDKAPPVISGGSPSGVIPSTTTTTLSVKTSESATCKYGQPGQNYSEMRYTFKTIDGLKHSLAISGLHNGWNYSYFVRCMDKAGNINTSDYKIAFQVAKTAGKSKK